MPPSSPDGSWTETVVHSLTGSDGALSYGPLINVDGTLYGTTTFRGAYGYGTVFSFVP